MHVIGLRHGQSGDLANRIRSLPATPLTELGRDQAREAARLLQRHGIVPRLIITSGMTRAIQTGEEVARVLGYGEPVPQWEILNERNCGEAEGLPEIEWRTRWDSLDKAPGAETMAALQERANAAWEKVLRLRGNGVVLLVSHRTFLRAPVRALEGRPWTDDEADYPHSLEPAQALQLYPVKQLLV